MKKLILFLLLCMGINSFARVTIRVASYKDDKVCAISHTFDDGMLEHYTLVAPELEKRGFRGTFWVCGQTVNADSGTPRDTTRVSWGQLRKMAEKGHEISNHTWSHPNLTRISIEEVKREIQQNDTAIFEYTGIFPRTFCYPYNALNEEVKAIASRDRAGTRTHQFGIGRNNSKSTPEKIQNWVDTLLVSGEWGASMIHGITYGYDLFGDPTLLWDHFDQIKIQENKIWVATFHQVAAYIEERNNIQLDTVREGEILKVTPVLELDKTIFTEPLTMVVENTGGKITVTQEGKELPVKTAPDKMMFDFDPYGGEMTIKQE
ncbi:MAG: polysaccharide deacetylase family protein [Bacteroides sp.]|nr:polysaccharide deacetylase family protein [Bacteroides sp.]